MITPENAAKAADAIYASRLAGSTGPFDGSPLEPGKLHLVADLALAGLDTGQLLADLRSGDAGAMAVKLRSFLVITYAYGFITACQAEKPPAFSSRPAIRYPGPGRRETGETPS
jgi:hypothetical protein